MPLFSRQPSSYEAARQRITREYGEDRKRPRQQKKRSLFDLVVAGTADEVRDVVAARRLDPNSRRHDGLTALHLAARFDNLDMIRALLELGADPTIAVEGTTAADEAHAHGAYRSFFLLAPDRRPDVAQVIPWLAALASRMGALGAARLLESDSEPDWIDAMDGDGHAGEQWSSVFQYRCLAAWQALPEPVQQAVGEEAAHDASRQAFVDSFAARFDELLPSWRAARRLDPTGGG